MAILSRHDQALFETTKRVLAEVVNEGLVNARLEGSATDGQQILCILNPKGDSSVKVALTPDTVLETRNGRVISVLRPDSLQPPVTISNASEEVLDPGTLFKLLSTSFRDVASERVIDEIVRELRNSAANQEKWLEISQDQPLLSLQDRSVDWERTLVYGHPSHPYHRLCYAQAPLKPVTPEDIPGMLQPALAFVSVPRADLRITGPFEQELQPLLERLNVPKATDDRVIVPCLAQQLPSIHQRFPGATVLQLTADCADAQASMRTLTLRPDLEFKYHLKLSLACQITSALRTITPWTTCGGPVQTALLEKLLPEDLWVFREVAAVSGSQENFNDGHLSCILRDSLDSRARENDESLIIAAALAQRPAGSSRTYAEVLYRLETIPQKKEWFAKYIRILFDLVLPPLVQYGVGLEGHGQNLVVRVCRQTGQIKGFAVRDFGGVRMHVPTLRAHGILSTDSLPPGAATLTENLQNVWTKVHHSLLQNHVGLLLGALGLERHGGWAITLETLSAVLEADKADSPGKALFENFTKDTMPFKCFLRMRMEGKYRDYIEREVPNLLLADSPRWQSILDTYKPSLHAT